MASYLNYLDNVLNLQQTKSKPEVENTPGAMQEQAMEQSPVLSNQTGTAQKSPQQKKPYNGAYNTTFLEVPPVSERQKDENGNTITLSDEDLQNEVNSNQESVNRNLQAETDPIKMGQKYTGNAAYDQSKAQNLVDSQLFSQTQAQMNQPLYDDTTTWSPQYTDMAFTEQFTRNLGQGMGTMISGIGDTFQFAPFLLGLGKIIDPEMDGNWVSRFFQELGNSIENAEMFKNYIPKDLHEVEWSDIFNKKLYSTHFAKMIPDAVAMLFAAKGIATGATKVTNSAVKALSKSGNLKGANTFGKGITNVVSGQEIFGSGGKIVGALATTEGLTAMGNGIVSGIAGGIGMNMMVSLRNASELINEMKEVKDVNENPLYSADDLAEMGVNAMKTNMNYIAVDIASFGMTFGGGWKILGKGIKQLNPLKNGSKLRTIAQQNEIAKKMFAYQTRPFLNGLTKIAGAAIPEAIEEQFQESWEEWAKKKARASKTGEPIEENFMDFFFSKENETTRVLSAVLGGVIGGGANITSAFNKTAENNYLLFDQNKNLSELIKKQGSEKEQTFQEYAINDQIRKIIANNMDDLLPGFLQNLEERGNITTKEKTEYEEIIKEFQKVREQADRLNIKGKEALLFNKHMEYTTNKIMVKNKEAALEKIKDIESNDDIIQSDKNKTISQISLEYEAQLKANSIILAKARQNSANLILGRKATPFNVDITFDENAQVNTIAGLAEDEYEALTIEGETEAKNKPKPKSQWFSFEGLTSKGKDISKEVQNKFKLNDNSIVSKVKNAFLKKEDFTDSKDAPEDVNTEAAKQKPITTESNATNTKAKSDEVTLESEEQAEKQIKPSSSLNETISDEELKTIMSDGISKKRLEDLAEKVKNQKELTEREAKLVPDYREKIQIINARKELNTNKAFDKPINPLDDLSNKDIQLIEAENNVKIQRNDDGSYDILTEKGNYVRDKKRIANVENAIQAKIDDNLKIEKEPDLNEDENAFVQEEATKQTAKGKTIAQAKKQKEIEAKKNTGFKKDQSNAIDDSGVFDSREPDVFIQAQNIVEVAAENAFIQKLLDKKYNDEIDFSQNELDNFINTNSIRNLQGPGNLEKMAVVNHALKNLFPNTKTPAQVIIVKNLYKSIGSQGIASVVGMTMFVDEKAWETSAYMHELSHIFFKLAKDEPEVKSMIKKILLDKELMKSIKQKYDDYTLYKLVFSDGSTQNWTKGKIAEILQNDLAPNQTIEELISNLLSTGKLQRVPIQEQEYLIEEAFVAKIEKPLDSVFDKTFNVKNEPQRKKDVTAFFGLLKRKGDIIKDNTAMMKELNKVFETDLNKEPDLQSYFFNVFKSVTKGVQLDSYGLDARAQKIDQEYIDKIKEIEKRQKKQFKDNPTSIKNLVAKISNPITNEEYFEDYEATLEENGEPFYNKEFDTHIKSTTRILKRFGIVYNKVIRANDAINWRTTGFKNQSKLFDAEQFESFVFKLAKENKTSKEFIYHIENSKLKEIQSFNNYLNKIFPDQKLILLNSMHYVLSNATHINGVRTVIDNEGQHKMENSLSQRELNMVDIQLDYLNEIRKINGETYIEFTEALRRIYRNNEVEEKDLLTVLQLITPKKISQYDLLQDGYITFRGVNIPIDTLLSGFIKKGIPFQKLSKVKDNPINSNLIPLVYQFRPLIQAIVDTGRKHTFYSVVQNAEKNYEPVRITNNLLTNELDKMIETLYDLKANKKLSDEEKRNQFIDTYSHNKNKAHSRSLPNQILEHFYDQYQKGIKPSIIQYHGLQDISDLKGNTFQKSTSLEQGLEDFMMFMQTAVKADGSMNNNYLGSMIAFSDSPRKFYMNLKRIPYNKIFDTKQNTLNRKGDLINSLYDLHNEIYANEKNNPYPTKTAFKKEFLKAIKETIDFINNNGEQIINQKMIKADSKVISSMAKYFDKNNVLTPEGEKLVTEYAVNTIANGYYMADTFAPGVEPNNIVKRFKANLSPIFSFKNPNLKTELMVFADRESELGKFSTDSGMYILREQAEELSAMGAGVFEMNNGFKLLNSHIEKDNPNFKSKLAYIKGYTTIIDKGHPLYESMKKRLDKYNEWHKKTYNSHRTSNYNDGTPNNIIIAVPLSSDKANFFDKKEALKFTEDYISKNLEEAQAFYDKMYYDKDGNFIGLSAYNFGPQQLMDKVSDTSNMPVQLISSVITNAKINGKLDFANKIQDLIAKEKLANLYNKIKKIKKTNPAAYYKFINKKLNKESMDQAQRIMFENNGSISNPYLVTITTNQLAKTLKNAGNKLKTNGTYAHQKPDTYWISVHNQNRPLKGYQTNLDGSLIPAEMVAPKHMADKSFARTYFTFLSIEGKNEITKFNDSTLTSYQKEKYRKISLKNRRDAELFILMNSAKKWAMLRHNIDSETLNRNLKKYIGLERNNRGEIIGYHVKGETVIATRVPSHGPSMTGVYEIIGYNDTDGNQVSVAGEMNKIMGSDNDGDALFIQQKSNKHSKIQTPYFDEAFDLITEYWLSPEMAEQVQAVIDVEKIAGDAVKKVGKKFNISESKYFPFSPLKRQEDYNNTMVSKRNVGPIFNIHKITNLLAAYEIKLKTPININNNIIDGFYDRKKGIESRNMQSALLANIILDNSKYFFADKLGINEHTINETALLINLGLNLEEIGYIFNSPVAKLYSELRRENNSLYHNNISNKELFKRVELILLRANELQKKSNTNKDFSEFIVLAKKQLESINYKNQTLKKRDKFYKIDTNKTEQFDQQFSILDTFNYLNELTSEVQHISGLMSGHNKVHVNPLVLSEQLNNLNDVLNNKVENQILKITDEFKSNADIKNYQETAEAILNQVKNIHPVFHVSTNKMIVNIKSMLSKNLNIKNIEDISQDIMLFHASRLLGHNNLSKEYVESIFDENNPENIFADIRNYLSSLDLNIISNPKKTRLMTDKNKSLLFTKALRIETNPHNSNKYISANSNLINDSFTPLERKLIQKEFEALPQDLKTKLFVYDLIERGFKGNLSILPYIDNTLITAINNASNKSMGSKNNPIDDKVIAQLEKTIMLKQAMKKSNPLNKITISPNEKLAPKIIKNKILYEKFKNGQSIYLNVLLKTDDKKPAKRLLYKVNSLNQVQKQKLGATNYKDQRNQFMEQFLNENIEMINNDLSKVKNNISIALIPDPVTGSPVLAPPQNIRNDVSFMAFNNQANELIKKLKKSNPDDIIMDAREDFYVETFTKKQPLTIQEYALANKYNKLIDQNQIESLYAAYQVEKNKANQLINNGILDKIVNANIEDLYKMYKQYGDLDVYAYANILMPVTKRIAEIKMHEQMKLHKDIKFDGKDISAIQAYMLSGSTIPSNHPASQALAREMEKQYKVFIDEKKKYINKLNTVTDALYKDRLGYGSEIGLFSGIEKFKNLINKIRSTFKKDNIYQKLYGNLVTRIEYINDKGTAVVDYKLKPVEEIESAFRRNEISQAEKDFYDTFRSISEELKPKLKKEEKNYIPHTSMSRMELFTSKGLLGLLANSRNEEEALYDVQMKHKGDLKSWKQIEDYYKIIAGKSGNNLNKIIEFKLLKNKAERLLKKGINEDGSKIIVSTPMTETALGFGAINRFANNRSVRATEIPSMDLNKAMGDYIHSTLFVHGNEKFEGMEKLQAHIEGVLAWNHSNNLPQMNKHIQIVWKDYFLRSKRQNSVFGETGDRVILGLTRLNLFYALGFQAIANTGGLYVLGNVLAGKYHNIKNQGGKKWLQGELRFWGLDKGLSNGPIAILDRLKRNQRIMKTLNFMEINVYDEINIEKKNGIDRIFTDLALAPMIQSEKWIQQVHMLGMLTEEELSKFDEQGNWINEDDKIDNERLIALEDEVKALHGRGYQPTDQRAFQMYSYGTMMLQFSRFVPTIIHDRFTKKDINIYGQETIGSLRAVGDMVRYVVNNPMEYTKYRNSLSPELRSRLDQGLRGMAMTAAITMFASNTKTGQDLFKDTSYYLNYEKLAGNLIPPAIQSTKNLLSQAF